MIEYDIHHFLLWQKMVYNITMRKIFYRKDLIYLSVFVLPLYLIKLKILGVPTNIFEILMVITFIFNFPDSQEYKSLAVNYRKYLISIALILCGLIISTLVNHNYYVGLGIIKGWFIIPLMLAFIITGKIKTEKEIKNVLQALYFSALAVSIIGLMYFFSGDVTYDGRLKAFYLSPNYLVMFLAPGLVYGIWHMVYGIPKKIDAKYQMLNTRYLYIAILIIIATAFYLTYSYAAWIAVIASFAILQMIKLKNKTLNSLFLFLASLMIVIIILTQWSSPKMQSLLNQDARSSVASRTVIWKSAIKMIGDKPILGIGPGNFQNIYLKYQKYFPPYLEWAVPQPHNLYLAFWLQGGMLGIIGFLLLLFYWFRDMINFVTQSFGRRIVSQKNIFQTQKNSDYLILAVLGIMLYILIHGLADTTYWKNDLAVIFWATFALGIAISKEANEAKS